MTNYQLKHETVTVNQVDYLIRSLKDRQQFDDDDKSAERLGISSATWALFGTLWPASKILASAACLMDLQGKSILEIGCGIALTSIVLHRMGLDITASDYHPLTKEFLDKNVVNNLLPPIQYQTGNWETENPLLGQFDLILGSDVLYEPAHAENVSRFIDRHSGTDVQVLIVDPGRSNRSQFTKKMASLGYTHHFERFHELGLDQKWIKGRILHFHRMDAGHDPYSTFRLTSRKASLSLSRHHQKEQTELNIHDIKIVGIDEEHPPSMRKEAYIDLFFKLSHKAPSDWCEAFNTLGHRINPPVKISTSKGIIMETWVRDMNQIQEHLDKIKVKIKQCNQQYIEKIKRDALALATRNASMTGLSGEQNRLNLIISELDFNS